MRVLVVESNPEFARHLAEQLTLARFTAEYSTEREDALYRLGTQNYDLAILDFDLPQINGPAVLSRIRSSGKTMPVLILSSVAACQACVDGLDAGADDYLRKPFEIPELLARIRVLLRRSMSKPDPIWRCGNLVFDSNSRQFFVEGNVLNVTPRERALLEVLMMRLGKTVAKNVLCDSIYSVDEMVAVDAIELYVHRLRKKLCGSTAMIGTLRGVGYLLKEKGQTASLT